MDLASQRLLGAGSAPAASPRAHRTASASRAQLEVLLSPFLAPECAGRLWSVAWHQSSVRPRSLWAWMGLYGEEVAALAVAAGLEENQLRQHLEDGQRPDRAVLEMLADLNCFPYVTPAARAMAEV